VEIVRPLDDLLDQPFFIGSELDGKAHYVNNAIFGCEPGHPLMQECLDYMRDFPLDHPEVENETGPRMFTNLMLKRGWKRDDSEQTVGDIHVYPRRYFYPYCWHEEFAPECITPDTHAIHHWAATWTQ
jgi:hypothetical protein